MNCLLMKPGKLQSPRTHPAVKVSGEGAEAAPRTFLLTSFCHQQQPNCVPCPCAAPTGAQPPCPCLWEQAGLSWGDGTPLWHQAPGSSCPSCSSLVLGGITQCIPLSVTAAQQKGEPCQEQPSGHTLRPTLPASALALPPGRNLLKK